jgi:hypothetical protein
VKRILTASQAKAAFEEIAREFPKQHLRLQFRKRFGTGELLELSMFKKGTIGPLRTKPVNHLLQEIPESIDCITLVGTAEKIQGEKWTTVGTPTIGELFTSTEAEQLLTVKGRRAKLFAYSDPTEEAVIVLRVTIELPNIEQSREGKSSAVPAKPTRKVRARRIAEQIDKGSSLR